MLPFPGSRGREAQEQGCSRIAEEVSDVLARPGLPSFQYVKPDTPAQVVSLLREHGAAAKLLMGGTDLFVRMRDGAVCPQIVIDVKHLPGMRDISYDRKGGLFVGAAVTMNQLARHPDVQAHYPLLVQAANSAASYQVRNRATIGGNLCNASPCADTAPATLVLDGQLVLYGPDGKRQVSADAFFVGPGQAAMAPDELLVSLRYPISPPGSRGAYLKLGRNVKGDLALVSVAVLGFPDETAASGFRFRIALGSVAPIPLRVPAAEEVLSTQESGEETFDLAAKKAQETASPIDDVRASRAYREAMVRTLTLRALRDVWEQLDEVHP
jgi:CO/xanthine dehydrogenase FAD-binding subunit